MPDEDVTKKPRRASRVVGQVPGVAPELLDQLAMPAVGVEREGDAAAPRGHRLERLRPGCTTRDGELAERVRRNAELLAREAPGPRKR